jgi:hypothetical protein
MQLNAFILERALASRSAQVTIALIWMWLEKTIAQWTTQIDAFIVQAEVAADANAVSNARRSELDEKLVVLHKRTQQGLSFLKTTFRNDITKGDALRTLSAAGNSRAQILAEALAFESAWEELDPAWEPMVGQTLALFKVLREEGDTCMATYSAAKAAWRHQTGNWKRLGTVLNRDCMAWYSIATRVFPVGTPEGDMIRGTVPTTPNSTPLPGLAEISLVDTAPGSVSMSLYANHATKYDVYRMGPGETEFTKVGSDVPEGLYVETGLTPGDYQYKAIGKNSRGSGPEGETASVTVP